MPLRNAAVEAPPAARQDEPVVEASAPIPVWAWISTASGKSFEARARALRWTARQAFVEYQDPAGRVGNAWLWASAVRRR
ncbi:hypothetical protein OMK64_01720 [Cellulomonas fimi]|uniref:hypothetical protein n=1 Tax=Cellulomonas fimi TaxID=1708 RepID=UPI00234D3886|nr:hypothetical protein [Cellulomonas fimi]MDC7120250.1 hypothetical protein [Cellulomonas fimi]